jgi:hypothetical protein
MHARDVRGIGVRHLVLFAVLLALVVGALIVVVTLAIDGESPDPEPSGSDVGTVAVDTTGARDAAPALAVVENVEPVRSLVPYLATPGELQFIEELALHSLTQQMERVRLIIEGPELHRSPTHTTTLNDWVEPVPSEGQERAGGSHPSIHPMMKRSIP